MRRERLSSVREIRLVWTVALVGAAGGVGAAIVGGSTLVRLAVGAGVALLVAVALRVGGWARR